MASIAAIRSLGHRDSTKLRKAGIRTTEAFLREAASRRGRRDLAERTGLDEKKILGWANRADLMRVPGIGSEYSDLLEFAGVDTIKELRRRNAANLLDTMTALNVKKRLVRRLPTEGMVGDWIEHAKGIEPVVTY